MFWKITGNCWGSEMQLRGQNPHNSPCCVPGVGIHCTLEPSLTPGGCIWLGPAVRIALEFSSPFLFFLYSGVFCLEEESRILWGLEEEKPVLQGILYLIKATAMLCWRLFPDNSNELKCILLPHYSLHHAFLLLRPGVAKLWPWTKLEPCLFCK